MPPSMLSRRRWLHTSVVSCGALVLPVSAGRGRLCAADVPDPGLNRFPRLMQDYFVAQVREVMKHRRARLAALKTKADAERYVSAVQDAIQRCFGPWPERTPLNPRITGVVDRDAYRIEKVIFESRPEFFVTANLYVPKGVSGRVPGVVGSCGHSASGKAYESYQGFAQGLARLGYVVLIFDPIGQGERLQLPDEHLKGRIGVGVPEHMMMGNSQHLLGEFFGSWRAWDGMRALDYLLSRDEVDPQHVGITGNSGGGTMTTWLCGVERRWTMGAPSCFVTSFLRNLENELSADSEQCPPDVLKEGLDHGDFLIAMAPKPIAILGQEKDYFDARGVIETYEQVKSVYKLLEAEANVSYHVGPGPHGYSQDAREAMYRCFNRATGRGDAPVSEPALKLEDDATLQCTKNGQVVELKSRPVYSFGADMARQLADKRGEVKGAELVEIVRSTVDVGRRDDRKFDYRILRPRTEKLFPLPSVTTYLLDHEPGMMLPVYRLYAGPHYSRPPMSDGPAILYVAHDSSDVELHSEPLLREVIEAEPTATLYATDVRGLGESRPNTCGANSYYTGYGCDYFYAVHAIMLGTSVLRGRIYDVTCALDFVRYHGGHRKIHVVAKGFGSVAAAPACLLYDEVTQVTLKHPLTSWQDIASADVYKWRLSSFLPNVLKHFDLPDVYRELEASKKLRMIEPRGAEGPG